MTVDGFFHPMKISIGLELDVPYFISARIIRRLSIFQAQQHI